MKTWISYEKNEKARFEPNFHKIRPFGEFPLISRVFTFPIEIPHRPRYLYIQALFFGDCMSARDGGRVGAP